MYTLQSEKGEYFFSVEEDKYGEIILFDTKEEAAAALAKMEKIIPAGMFFVVKYTENPQKERKLFTE